MPAITAVQPSKLPAGATTWIAGSGFTGATAVKFGNTNANFTLFNDGAIRATVPAGSGSVLVTVVTPSGTSNGKAFCYSGTPGATIQAVQPTSGPSAGGTPVTLVGYGFTGATDVKFGSTSAPILANLQGKVIQTTAPAGTGTVLVSVVTPVGPGCGIAYDYVGVPVPPSVDSVVPDEGPAGQQVTISGSGFTGVTSVQFGVVEAGFVFVDDSTVVATAPDGVAGSLVDVTVTTPNGSDTLEDAYTYVPAVTSVVPDEGPEGQEVIISGFGFTGATSVTFGGVEATSFMVADDDTVFAVVPAGSGTVAVTVSTPNGDATLADAYTYVVVPEITLVEPSTGPAVGGQDVTISGSGFSGATSVTFGGVDATSFIVENDTTITATTPPGTAYTTVDVEVTTPGGTATGSYTYTLFAYVTNQTDATVSVIDTSDDTVADTINGENFQGPAGVALTPDGSKVYVANSSGEEVTVVDAGNNVVTGSLITVGISPYGVAIAGTKAYVPNSTDSTVSVIDTATDTVTDTINGENFNTPFWVAIAGTTAYVTNAANDTVTVINTATDTVTTTINGTNFNSPREIAVTPDGTKAYVANNGGTTVTVIDTGTNTVSGTPITVGTSPYGVAFTPDGTKAYVTNEGGNSVSVIDTSDNTVITTITDAGFNEPRGVAVTPDGSKVYVANYGGSTVSVIDTSDNSVTTTTVGNNPFGVAIVNV
ncbi:IPT/TIG domain-containing protein [Streptomyces sp. WMMB 322]|uniref:IPT/TIG domain-containing protein n=1 Tax=Streptomyces sp. WMMB 322 TaxID=1286821 RepID=UPI00082381D0|nr:IPT/TIG domain-containing protein [Streptomyces sp. WMMB 322]SCK31427.1 40-residue YVTN family beta-propeller repeat-containing protein [Streptomyces sp. WMMB 322]